VTYQPPPANPYWTPQPPAKKPTPWKLIGGITAAVVFLCCGGFLAIGIFADPPAEKTGTGTVAAPLAAPVTTTTSAPAPPAETSPPTASDSPTPARSSSPAAKRSPAAVKTSKASPAPKKTSRKPKPKPTTREPEPAAVYYKNCTAVRAAGADPIRRGDPGYGRHLDRDGDGVGCE
jgi:hypothetical protein